MPNGRHKKETASENPIHEDLVATDVYQIQVQQTNLGLGNRAFTQELFMTLAGMGKKIHV